MDKHTNTLSHARTGPPDTERPIPVTVESGPILVATDGRSGADSALVAAAFLAGRTGAEVRVVSVVEPLPPAGIARNEVKRVATDREVARRQMVEEQLRRTVGDDAGWSVTISTGSLGKAIRFAAGTGARLIILGRRWQHAVGNTEESTATLRVLATTTTPVYVVSHGTPGVPTRAVVAIDFGAASLRAARIVSELVTAGGTMYLVHVTSLTTRRLDPGAPAAAEPVVADIRAALDRIGQSLRHAGATRVQSIILYGQASAELLAFADGVFADLIACGASTVPPFHDGTPPPRRVGGVATDVLHSATCSIVVAPLPSFFPEQVSS